MEQHEEKIGKYRLSDIICCLGKEEDYPRRFSIIEYGRGRKFNFCAGFFGQWWLAYRMMVPEALIFMGIFSVIDIAVFFLFASVLGNNAELIYEELIVGLRRFIVLLSDLIAFLVMGFFGDRIYWRHIRKLMDSFQCGEKEKDSHTQAELRWLGGCSLMSMVFFGIVLVVLRKICGVMGIRLILTLSS